MKIERVTTLRNIERLAKIIFLNFIELENQPDIQFSIEDIKSTLSSSSLIAWLLLDDDSKIVGYLVGSTKELGDGRYVYYLSYFYIIKKYRGTGLGKRMLLMCIDYITKSNIKFILLISRINSPAYNLYLKLGFLPDPVIILKNNDYKVLIYYTD
jgi:ribosomal protein S18 acetylase RimI-like enzyme